MKLCYKQRTFEVLERNFQPIFKQFARERTNSKSSLKFFKIQIEKTQSRLVYY